MVAPYCQALAAEAHATWATGLLTLAPPMIREALGGERTTLRPLQVAIHMIYACPQARYDNRANDDKVAPNRGYSLPSRQNAGRRIGERLRYTRCVSDITLMRSANQFDLATSRHTQTSRSRPSRGRITIRAVCSTLCPLPRANPSRKIRVRDPLNPIDAPRVLLQFHNATNS